MDIKGILQKRSSVLAFLDVGTGDTPDFQRMQGFTDLSESYNPREYSRQYVDEESEQTDVTGFSPAIAFAFDWYKGNPVHDFLVDKIGRFATGNDAVITILNVVVETGEAFIRKWAIVPSDSGSGTDAFIYSGEFRSKGEQTLGTAELSSDGLSAEFTPYPMP